MSDPARCVATQASPKGVLHTTGGYMVMAGTTTRYSFDLQPGDVWWCTADPGDAGILCIEASKSGSGSCLNNSR